MTACAVRAVVDASSMPLRTSLSLNGTSSVSVTSQGLAVFSAVNVNCHCPRDALVPSCRWRQVVRTAMMALPTMPVAWSLASVFPANFSRMRWAAATSSSHEATSATSAVAFDMSFVRSVAM